MSWAQFFRDAALGTTAYMSMKAANGIESLNNAFSEYQRQSKEQIESLRSDIKQGFAELSLELAIHSEIFKNILNVLQNKRKNEAEELKQFGITALRNGWIDDAIKDFDKSIEINRYDYQVYYLLAKCYAQKGEGDLRNKNLELAYHYSSEDPSFRLFVFLDIITGLVDEGNFDEAKRIIDFAEQSVGNDVDLSPLLLAKIYMDIFEKKVTDSTLNAISNALDCYTGDDPSKIMTIILALVQQCDEETRLKVENLFNLNKLGITQKYGKKVITYFENIGKFLAFVQKMVTNNIYLSQAPSQVIGRFFPLYHSIPMICDRIRNITHSGNALTIEHFDKYLFLMPALSSLETLIIEDTKWVVAPQPQDTSFNAKPYKQVYTPNYNFKLGANDKILLQVETTSGAILTLSIFKILIVDEEKNTYQYDLFDDYLNLPLSELSRCSNSNVSFFIRDRISDKVLQVANSPKYSYDYTTINDQYANLIDLFTQRAANLLLNYIKMAQFNIHLEYLNAFLDVLPASPSGKAVAPKPVAHVEAVINNNVDDVEFLD